MSETAEELAQQLRDALNAFIRLVERIPAERWAEVTEPGEWSPGKDAEHVAAGNALHQWVVRSAIGQPAGTRPVIERKRLTAQLAQAEVIRVLKLRAEESSNLILGLGEVELDLPCRGRAVRVFIERVLVGHIRTHQVAIERKLRASGRRG